MSKAYHYANNEAKIGVGMKEVSLKDAQDALQTCNNWKFYWY
jgi:hypothetical protein